MPPTDSDSDSDGIDLDSLEHVPAGTRTNGARTLAIRPSRDGYITAPADDAYFDEVDHVAVYVSKKDDALAFEPVADDDLARYHELDILKLQRENDRGAKVSLKSAFEALGADKQTWTLEETVHVDLERQDGFLVAEVADVLPADRDLPETDGGQGQGAGDVTGGTTVDQPDAVAGPARAPPRGFREIADRVDTLEAFADEIGEPEGIARKIAMDLGVYGDLRDNPGAYRGGVES